MKKRNLVIFHLHDMGRYCSPYGYALPTPNMDRLADGGTVFRQAHCVAPTCSPSRAAMLTGQTSHQSGMTGLLHRGFRLTHPTRHLAHFLGQAGYATAYAGVQHEFTGEDCPYHQKLEAPAGTTGNRDEQTAAAAVDFLRNAPPQPFFLWAGMFWPHRDFLDADKEPYSIGAVRPPEGLPDTPELRAEMRDYAASVACADACIGRMLDALEAHGLAENTLLVLTTDHGIPFPGMKGHLTDAGTGVALIVREPGSDHPPAESDALVSHLDLFPTVCDWLDLPAPEWLQGRSLVPLLRGESTIGHDAVFAEVNYHACYDPMRSVRTDRYKLIRIFGDTRTVMPNIDDSPSKRFLMEHGLSRETRRDPVQLYDLHLDPHETRNLAGMPETADIQAKLEARLRHWMTATDDPLLHGPMPLPAKAQLNRMSDTHPDTSNGELIDYVGD